ncbi:DUF11 domain-containing protein [Paenibacillus profundus]|uniref:DUF11 domain-containing protein n=1 Tax=Paenibacillus profundus TaxID=1173085 RepID=A0ABS8YGI1_9BACL|nr:SdrD B-like domain-containing protein [Paenibacillus profundus]MCE5170202.1 DUF11 domain-containing protein [Paenibacillus profundus]
MKRIKKFQAIVWALVLVLNVVLSPAAAHANDASGDGSIIRLSVNEQEVLTGKTFTYTIDYSLSSTTGDFSSAVIELPLPEGVELVNDDGNGIKGDEFALGEYDDQERKVTFTFKADTASGKTGTLQVNARFPNYTTPNGTTASTNVAFKRSPDSTPVEFNTAAVTAVASAEWALVKERVVPVEGIQPRPGTNVTYQITLKDIKGKNNSEKYGNLNVSHVTITDILPDAAAFIKAEPAPSSQKGQTLTWDIDADKLNNKPKDRSATILVTVSYPENVLELVKDDPPVEIIDEHGKVVYKGSGVMNKAAASLQPLGENPLDNLKAEAKHGFIKEPNGGMWIYKQIWDGAEKELSEGQGVTYSIGGLSNSSNVPLDNVKITDMTPKGMTLEFIDLPRFAGEQLGSYSLEYTTNHEPDEGDWKIWRSALSFPSEYRVDAKDLPSVKPEEIKGIRLVFGNVPLHFQQQNALQLRYTFTSYKDVEQDGYKYGSFPLLNQKFPDHKYGYLDEENGLPSDEEARFHNKQWKQIINYAKLEYGYGTERKEHWDAIKALAVAERPLIQVEKYANGSSFKPGDKVTYTLKVTNKSPNGVPFKDPIVSDLLPRELEYVESSWKLDMEKGAVPTPDFKREDLNSQGSKLIWTWGPDTFTLEPNKTLIITFDANVSTGVTTGTIDNEVEVTSATQTYVNSFPKNFDNQKFKDGKWYVYSNVTINVNSATNLEAVKYVQGDLDNGQWSKYPATGTVSSGGKINYKLEVKNSGTVDVKKVTIVDVLPRKGDIGVIDRSPRDSKWSPILTEAIKYEDVDVYYSTSDNVSMTTGSWSTEPPQDLTTVKALKFVFAQQTALKPGETKVLEWTMRSPVGAPVGDEEIAWNSFGFTASRTDTNTDLLPAEPLKVGIKIKNSPKAEIGNYVWFDKDGIGIQTNDSHLGVNGVKVELYDADSKELLEATLTGDDHEGNPGYYLFTGLDKGKYFVKFHLPEEYTGFTKQGAGDDRNLDSDAKPEGTTDIIELNRGDKRHDIDAGLVKRKLPPNPEPKKGAIGKYVWIDSNGNGVQDDENTGLNGVTVELYNKDGNKKLTSTVTRSVYYSTVTNSVYDPTVTGSVYDPTVTDYVYRSGYYLFDNLDAGDYKVKFFAPDGYTFTLKDAGDNRALDSNAYKDGWTDVIALAQGEHNMTIDAGLVRKPVDPVEPNKGAIGNYVWFDANRNGIQDDGDTGMNGITVQLYDADGKWLSSTVTETVYKDTVTGAVYESGKPGYYLFDNLDAGDYKVRFIAPDGYTFTLTGAGDDRSLDSDAYKDGWTDVIALAQGEHNMTIDAGLIRKPSAPGPDPDPDRPGGSDNSGGDPSTPNPTTEPDRPSEPSNPDSDRDEPSDVNYPGDNTEGEQDENNDDANDTEVDGDTDSEPNKDEQPKSTPKNTDTLPQTGEDAPVAPVIGIILCALALVAWLARQKIFAQN